MSEVRLRTRKSRASRVREIQGMLAMQGLLLEAEQESTRAKEQESTGQAECVDATLWELRVPMGGEGGVEK